MYMYCENKNVTFSILFLTLNTAQPWQISTRGTSVNLEIMEAPNIVQEENKKLRATIEDLTRKLNIVEEENKKLREAASSAASAVAGSQHDAFQDAGAPRTPAR